MSRQSSAASRARFAATRWSIVLAAAEHRDATSSRQALEELAQAYWYPLYAFLRRKGERHAAAQDLVQDFFAQLLEKRYLSQVAPDRGRFRSFLLACAEHFLSNHRKKARAAKRGAGKVISLDGMDAAARYAAEPADCLTPQRLFDRQWAVTVLDIVLRRLADEYAKAGKARIYHALESALSGQALDYSKLAAELDMAQGAIRVAAHRLRRRYRDLLKSQIAQTVESADQVQEEITHLLNCL